MHALSGDLSVVSMASLLQLVQDDGLGGRLVVDGQGSVDFVQGRPVAARCGELEGELALLELFVKPGARFHLDTAVAVDGEVLGDVIALLMEGCRLSDEWERIRAHGLAIPEDEVLEPELQPLATDLRAGLALEVVARRAGLAGAELVDLVMELVEDGRAELCEATAPPLELDYWGALDLGLRAYRDKDFAEAVRAFSHALSQRPDDRRAAQNLRAARRKLETP